MVRLKRDTAVLVTVDEDKNLSFIQTAGMQEKENNGEGIERVSGLKNQANKRMTALNNATNLAIAKGGDALDEEKVLETAKKFLEFLGDKEGESIQLMVTAVLDIAFSAKNPLQGSQHN